MSNNTVNDPKIQAASEELVRDVFTPALQDAVGKAIEAGHGQTEMLNGALYAFANMLNMTLGSQQSTARLLRDFADHLEQSAPADQAAQPTSQ